MKLFPQLPLMSLDSSQLQALHRADLTSFFKEQPDDYSWRLLYHIKAPILVDSGTKLLFVPGLSHEYMLSNWVRESARAAIRELRLADGITHVGIYDLGDSSFVEATVRYAFNVQGQAKSLLSSAMASQMRMRDILLGLLPPASRYVSGGIIHDNDRSKFLDSRMEVPRMREDLLERVEACREVFILS